MVKQINQLNTETVLHYILSWNLLFNFWCVTFNSYEIVKIMFFIFCFVVIFFKNFKHCFWRNEQTYANADFRTNLNTKIKEKKIKLELIKFFGSTCPNQIIWGIIVFGWLKPFKELQIEQKWGLILLERLWALLSNLALAQIAKIQFQIQSECCVYLYSLVVGVRPQKIKCFSKEKQQTYLTFSNLILLYIPFLLRASLRILRALRVENHHLWFIYHSIQNLILYPMIWKSLLTFFPVYSMYFSLVFLAFFIEKMNKHRKNNQYHSITLYSCKDSIVTSIFTLKNNVPKIVKTASSQRNSISW